MKMYVITEKYSNDMIRVVHPAFKKIEHAEEFMNIGCIKETENIIHEIEVTI